MLQKDLRIIYYGTAHFAVGCLQALIESGFNVVSVVTATDKPAGRGHKLQSSPVKEYALAQGLPVLQPHSLKDPLFLQSVRDLNPSIGIVVAFRMMPQELWTLPPLGTYNIHASLLPQLRGAAPINWALIHGLRQTGVTLFKLQHEIDTGEIVAQSSVELSTTINFGELYNQLMHLGALLLVQQLEKYLLSGTLCGTPQTESSEWLPAPKLNKENTRISWTASAFEIHNQIRGLSPIPAAWSTLKTEGENSTPVQIIASALLPVPPEEIDLSQLSVGRAVIFAKRRLAVQTGNGLLELLSLKPSGKKLLTATDFINGTMRNHPDILFV